MTTRTAEQVTDSAVTWIAKAGNAKLHIWLHYFDPHDPYAPPTVPALNGHHPGDRRARQCAGDPRRVACERHGNRESLFSPAETRRLVDLYDQEIRYLDREVGRVLAALGPRLHRAVVIFTSDHGERLGEGGQWDHCQSLHSREIDVPLLVSVRQRPIPKLGDPHVPVSTLDLAPTILGLIGLDKGDSRLDGWDLLRVPTGRKVIAVWQKQQVIMNGPYKLYAHPNHVQLFRVDRDPAEENDLAATEPGVRDALATALASVTEQYREAQDASQQIAEQLRAIGYVQ
jgi:arylsulfatase A-like enzyme